MSSRAQDAAGTAITWEARRERLDQQVRDRMMYSNWGGLKKDCHWRIARGIDREKTQGRKEEVLYSEAGSGKKSIY